MPVRFSFPRDGITMFVRFSLLRDGIIMFVRFSLSRGGIIMPRQTETNEHNNTPLDKLKRTDIIIPSLDKLKRTDVYYYVRSFQFV
jgi:hypothetical protein